MRSTVLAGILVVLPFAAFAGQDPFSDPTAMRKPKKEATPFNFPTIEERRDQWRSRRADALKTGQLAPEVSEQFLVSELEVKGIFASERGPSALLKVKGGTQTFMVREGSKLFNGSIVKIEDEKTPDVAAGSPAGKVVCTEILDPGKPGRPRALPYFIKPQR